MEERRSACESASRRLGRMKPQRAERTLDPREIQRYGSVSPYRDNLTKMLPPSTGGDVTPEIVEECSFWESHTHLCAERPQPRLFRSIITLKGSVRQLLLVFNWPRDGRMS